MGVDAKVLLVTEKPFAADAVTKIESTLTGGGASLQKLESYKEKAELLAAIADADAIICRSDKIDGEVMDAAKKLKLIVRAGAGVDTIDLPAATERKLVVMNTPGQNSNAVAELVFGMVISHARNHWDGTSGWELKGKKLGLYGFGAVAKNVARIAKGFEMEIVALDPFVEDMTPFGVTKTSNVADLFDCNVVSLHIPAIPETIKSIGKDLLERMPKKGVLVNTARKEVIDEDAMKTVFASRSDLQYVADVQPDNMADLGAQAFCTKKKMGAQTSEANNNAGIAAAQQILAYFESGDVRCQVNKDGKTF